jgi:peptidoglycan/xylan/chitin deacetylase (PgdA/CDA1 family)
MSHQVTLTFDNGPSAEVTPYVLDTLAKHGIKTTFFVIGEMLDDPAARAATERAVAEGHWVGNHTNTHRKTLGQFEDFQESVAELTRCDEKIGDLAHPDHFIRPFADGGILDERVLNPVAYQHLLDDKATVVLWSAVPEDWVDDAWVDRAMKQIEEQPWSLMVLHDIPLAHWSKLDEFLTRARDAGVTFRQDFPDHSVPIRRGELQWSIDHLIAQTPVEQSEAVRQELERVRQLR